MCSSLKINTACHRSFVFIVEFDHSQRINIVSLLLTLNKYLSVGCERQVLMFWKPYSEKGLFHSAISHRTQLKQITTTLSAYYDMNILFAYVSSLNLL